MGQFMDKEVEECGQSLHQLRILSRIIKSNLIGP